MRGLWLDLEAFPDPTILPEKVGLLVFRLARQPSPRFPLAYGMQAVGELPMTVSSTLQKTKEKYQEGDSLLFRNFEPQVYTIWNCRTSRAREGWLSAHLVTITR